MNKPGLSSPEKPLIKSLEARVLERHTLQDNFLWEGRVFAYTAFIAAGDTIEEAVQSGKDIDDLFKTIRRETRFTPNEIIGLDETVQAENWEQCIKDVCTRILTSEVKENSPHLREIDESRRVEFDDY